MAIATFAMAMGSVAACSSSDSTSQSAPQNAGGQTGSSGSSGAAGTNLGASGTNLGAFGGGGGGGHKGGSAGAEATGGAHVVGGGGAGHTASAGGNSASGIGGNAGANTAASGGNGLPPVDGGVDDAQAPDAGQDPASHGGTITFQSIGAPGWYPSIRDPASGSCDAYQSATCCLATENVASDALTPWDQDLIMTLRGPMQVAQLAVYQPPADGAATWNLVSEWDNASPASSQGISFDGNDTDKTGFPGNVGTECLVNVATAQVFPCGAGSSPYCTSPSGGKQRHQGWAGSKLFVILASMPHAGDVPGPCSKDATGNWYDAPWIGLSLGELVRAGSFSSCQCYAKDPTKGYLADGCGQFNVFEVVNDNNQYKNLDVFSTDMIDYAGYVGEGPCGPKCDVGKLDPAVDLIDKSADTEAAMGALSDPKKGPGAAFRRPVLGSRYFLILLDVPSRTVQLAMVHPKAVPGSITGLLPALPASVGSPVIDAVRALRLPN